MTYIQKSIARGQYNSSTDNLYADNVLINKLLTLLMSFGNTYTGRQTETLAHTLNVHRHTTRSKQFIEMDYRHIRWRNNPASFGTNSGKRFPGNILFDCSYFSMWM